MEKVYRRLKQYLEKVIFPLCSTTTTYAHAHPCFVSAGPRQERVQARRRSTCSALGPSTTRAIRHGRGRTWAKQARHGTRLRLWRTCLRRSIIVVEYSAKAEVETFPLGDDAKAIFAFERSIAFPDTAAHFFCLYNMPLTLQSSSLYIYAVQRTENLKVRVIAPVSEYRDSDNIISNLSWWRSGYSGGSWPRAERNCDWTDVLA